MLDIFTCYIDSCVVLSTLSFLLADGLFIYADIIMFLITFLLLHGDVESNPGPHSDYTSTSETTSLHSEDGELLFRSKSFKLIR